MKRLLAAASLFITACSQSESAPDDRIAAPELRLYALDCGHVEMLDLSIFARGGEFDGMTNSARNGCFLVRHPKGDFLWDTGLPDAVNAEEDGITSGAFHLSMPSTLIGQLEELGLSPEDIEYFSLSHSHFDHTGNAGRFADSVFIIHEAEFAHMFRPEARADERSFASYAALENGEVVTFTEQYDVFGDERVRIIAMPGHTPGHSVLLVELESEGSVLLSGDLYHLTEAREKRTVPTFNTDAEETLRSMEKFEALAEKTSARVIIQHEKEDMESLPKPPAFLH